MGVRSSSSTPGVPCALPCPVPFTVMCQRSVSTMAPAFSATTITGRVTVVGCSSALNVTSTSTSPPAGMLGTVTCSPAIAYSPTCATVAARASVSDPETGPRRGVSVRPVAGSEPSLCTRTFTRMGSRLGAVEGASRSEILTPCVPSPSLTCEFTHWSATAGLSGASGTGMDCAAASGSPAAHAAAHAAAIKIPRAPCAPRDITAESPAPHHAPRAPNPASDQSRCAPTCAHPRTPNTQSAH